MVEAEISKKNSTRPEKHASSQSLSGLPVFHERCGCGPLVQLCCAAIADMLRTKTPLELCKVCTLLLFFLSRNKNPRPVYPHML